MQENFWIKMEKKKENSNSSEVPREKKEGEKFSRPSLSSIERALNSADEPASRESSKERVERLKRKNYGPKEVVDNVEVKEKNIDQKNIPISRDTDLLQEEIGKALSEEGQTVKVELVKDGEPAEEVNLDDIIQGRKFSTDDIIIIEKIKVKDVTKIVFTKKKKLEEEKLNGSTPRFLGTGVTTEEVPFVTKKPEIANNIKKDIVANYTETKKKDDEFVRAQEPVSRETSETKGNHEQQINENFEEVDRQEYIDVKRTECQITFSQNRGKTKYFYKVKDHQELYKVGTSYYDDFKNGLKSFAFSSPDLGRSQDKAVLALASFFEHNEDVKIGIVSVDIENDFLEATIKESDKKTASIGNVVVDYFDHHDKIHLIDFSCIKKNVGPVAGINEVEQVISFIVDNYDLIFWSLPSLNTMEQERPFYFPLTRFFDNVSLVIQKGKTKTKELEKLISFYQKYGIKLKGVLYDT